MLEHSAHTASVVKPLSLIIPHGRNGGEVDDKCWPIVSCYVYIIVRGQNCPVLTVPNWRLYNGVSRRIVMTRQAWDIGESIQRLGSSGPPCRGPEDPPQQGR